VKSGFTVLVNTDCFTGGRRQGISELLKVISSRLLIQDRDPVDWSESVAVISLLCRFSDAGMTRGVSHSGGRRPKSATARSRGKFGGGAVERYAPLASQPRVGTPNPKPPLGTRRRVGGTFSGSGIPPPVEKAKASQ
jgi:hypothetical protein